MSFLDQLPEDFASVVRGEGKCHRAALSCPMSMSPAQLNLTQLTSTELSYFRYTFTYSISRQPFRSSAQYSAPGSPLVKPHATILSSNLVACSQPCNLSIPLCGPLSTLHRSKLTPHLSQTTSWRSLPWTHTSSAASWTTLGRSGWESECGDSGAQPSVFTQRVCRGKGHRKEAGAFLCC